MLTNNRSMALLFLILGLLVYATTSQADENWYPYPVQQWSPAFDMSSPRTDTEYVPLEQASKKWKICVSFPHLKDAYWLAVNYGVVEEAKRLKVSLQLVEAGGYTNLSNQVSQIENCANAGSNAVVIGAISADGLNNVVNELAKKDIPVIDMINGMSSKKLAAKSLVSFGEMGAKAGQYLVTLHPKESTKKVNVAWFPGPPGAGWVEAGNAGFTKAVEEGSINLVATKYGDTGKEVQAKLIEDVLEAHQDVDYIVGTAVTAEAAVPILRSRGLINKVKVLSYYYTPGVDRGIARGQILAAPTDSPVIQGRIAIDQAIRILENKSYKKHVGPKLFVVSDQNYKQFDTSSTLAPKGFKPVFTVK